MKSFLLQERIETVADDADLEEVYNTELHLLYGPPARVPGIICWLRVLSSIGIFLMTESEETIGCRRVLLVRIDT